MRPSHTTSTRFERRKREALIGWAGRDVPRSNDRGSCAPWSGLGILRSGPGDPDYMPEFVAEDTTLGEVLKKYCAAGRHIVWSLENDVVNIRSVDLKTRKKNPLDIVVRELELKQGTSLQDCRAALVGLLKERGEKMGVFVYARPPEGTVVLDDNVHAMQTTCLSRTRTYKDMTVRAILNDLVRPFANVVWISTLTGREEDEKCYLTLSFGSWRMKSRDELGRSVSRLVSSMKYAAVAHKIPGGGFASKKECLMDLYVAYQKNPDETMKKLSDAISDEKDANLQKELEEIKKYLVGAFHRYAHFILRVSY